MNDVTVRKRYKKNGEVIFEYRFEIAVIDGKRQWQSKSGFKTVTEARRAGRLAQEQYENYGKVVSKDDISFSDFLDIWLSNDCAVDLKSSTIAGYKKRIDNMIKPILGGYRLKAISKEVLQSFIIKLFDKGYSYNTLTGIKGLLTKSLSYAEDNHYIALSPASRLKIPINRMPTTPTRVAPHVYIPKDVMDRIFERFPQGTSSYLPLKLGYECGLRLGEAFGLCWEDIDLENKLLHINRQVQWCPDNTRDMVDKLEKNGSADCGDGYWYFAEPKYKSYRTIELSDSLINTLIEIKAKQIRAKDYYGCFYTNYDVMYSLNFDGKTPKAIIPENRIYTKGEGLPIHLLNVREDGTFVSPRTMQHASRIIKKEIFTDFDFHSLRKTHASVLAENGVDQKYIQSRLGHKNIEMTINVYEETTPMIRQRGRAILNKLF